MYITLITVGKIKEKYFVNAIKEYHKRLGRYAKMQLIEVADEKAPERLSEAEMAQVKSAEGERILKKIPNNSYVVTLEIEGKKLSSEAFAQKIKSWQVSGQSHITFIIGGSLGLADEVKAKRNFALSFSDMTFPHQLMKVICLEQIYRAFRINHNEPYHK